MNSYWTNLPVTDINKTIQFFTGLGLTERDGTVANERVAFKLGDQSLLFFQKDKIKENVDYELIDGHTHNEILISFEASSNEEIDQIAEKIEVLGGQLLIEPQKIKGYYGIMFKDPDGHLFNIIVM